MRKHRFFLWIFFIFLSRYAVASVEIRSIHLTTEDGLADNTARYIFQDSKGYIWLSTLNGLSRYDGTSFVTFRPEGGKKLSLADHHVGHADEDANGFLWIATNPELYSCYDLKKDRFVDFTGCGEYKQNYSYKMTDSQGNIWLWQDGNGCRKITYADGQFTSVAYKRELGNLLCSHVIYVREDNNGTVWIGTKEGIARVEGDKAVTVERDHYAFDALACGKDVFFVSAAGRISVQRNGADNRVLAQLGDGNKISQVYGTFQLKNKWYIFTDIGGYEFDLATFHAERSRELDIRNGVVETDQQGNYWVYNHTGNVWYVDARTAAVKTFRLIPADKINYIDEERYHVVCDSHGIIWISTYGNGLFAYDPASDEMQHITSDINGSGHIASNFLLYVMEDRSGCIWVSSEYTGLSCLYIVNDGAERIFPEKESLEDRSNAVRMITYMDNGEIWMGTRHGGLYTYDGQLQTQLSSRYFPSSIYGATTDSEGKVWLGSRTGGLCIDGKWYMNDANDSTSLSSNNIFTLYRDRNGRIWVGTFGGGLDLPVKENGTYTFRHFLNNSYSQRQIRVIREDGNGRIWVGTSDGIYIFHPDSILQQPDNYVTYNYHKGNLLSNEIKCIFRDSKGRMWVGTSGQGISMCVPEGDCRNLSFEYYGIEDGLANNMVLSILEDREGKLWVTTEYGISRFDPDTHTFENFIFSAYSLGNVYSENTGCAGKDGKLFFGSNYGLVIITPEKIVNNTTLLPTVTFTSLLVNGIPVYPGDADSPLEHAMAYTDEIKVKYFQNSLLFSFSTFDYSGKNGTKYTYRLDDYDKGWSTPSSLNFASCKNLAPGSYVLHVKACNGAGVWSKEETVLKITIAPPFWKTTWAFLIYAILILVILYITYRIVRDINALRNRIQVEKQLTEYKLMFFTNISHEFRSPLTLILGALERLRRGRIPKEMTDSLKIMGKSTERMLRLINQLLEFRKMQNDKLALSLEETDVIAFLYEIFLTFSDTAESKNMDFKFLPSVATYKMFIDKGNLDKVTYNLLSNAFKYTPSNGKVTFSITVEEEKKQLVIAVADTGVGIPEEKRGELFKRFMQSSFSNSSMGVGLHLTHELVNVHKGTIEYQENEGGGSVFTVTLPTDPSVYEEKDFLIPNNILLEEENERHDAAFVEEAATHLSANPLNKRKVLIIEDDNDVREFLKEEISPYCEVVTASDGRSGLERARTYDADLIICDVLMPGMTGFEVTRKLKNDFDTSHIPIILLTGMNSPESHLKGVESGADAYITKPFSPKLLLAHAFKLMEQREKLREKFSNAPDMIRPAICTSEKDKEFADKLQAVLEQQLGNAQFNIDEFASLMGLGRTVFYRKVRGVTGYSLNEYVRVIRMKKAAELLLENHYTVAEVSYRVGINDPFYFSKCFKQQFGMAPSVYLRGKEKDAGNEPS